MKRILLLMALVLVCAMPLPSFAQLARVSSVHAKHVTETSAIITWHSIPRAHFYKVRLENTNGEKIKLWSLVHDHTKKINSSLNLLTTNTSYQVNVRACKTKHYCGKWSTATTFTTDAAVTQQDLQAPVEPTPTMSYDCSTNSYNCSNFSTHADAQAAFDYCQSQGAGDIYDLDRDGNGFACESLD